MNILPLLISAVAVLLSAAAFLKVLGSRKDAGSDSSRLDEAAALQARIERISAQLGAIESACAALPPALEGLRGDLGQVPAALAVLPGQIARETGALDVLSELRAIRETGTVAAERLAGVRTELQTTGVARDAGFRRLTESVAAVQAALEAGAARGSSDSEPLLEALREATARGEAGRQAVQERLDALVCLPDLLRSLQASVVAQDSSSRLDALAASLSVVPESLRSLSATLSAQDPSARLDAIATSLAGLPESVRDLTAVAAAQDPSSRLDAAAASLATIADLLRSVDGSLPALDMSDRLDRQTAALLELRTDLASAAERLAATTSGAGGAEAQERERAEAAAIVRDERLSKALEELAIELSGGLEALREVVSTLPARTAEEIAARPAPAPELEELAMAVRDAGALRGDSVRSVADAVSRVAERLEESAENGRAAREDAASRLADSLATLESVASGVREALLPLGQALKGHGESVLPVLDGLGKAQERFEEAAVSLRVNQVEFASSVGLFSSAAHDLSAGLGAFAREGGEDEARDPAAVQQALLDALDRLLTGFAESLRATLAEADLRHREALAEIAARLPGSAG